MTGKGLLAIGLAVIAGVFLALVIQARSEDKKKLATEEVDREDLERERSQNSACEAAMANAMVAAGARIEEMYGRGARQQVREIAERRCREDGWHAEVTQCLEAADDAGSFSRCVGQLMPDAHRKLMSELEKIPRDGSSTDPWPSGTAGVGGMLAGDPDGPPDCVEYARLIDKFASCDQVPASTRDALRQSFDQMKQAWTNLPADAWDSMGTACKQGGDALRQALTSLCP